MLPFTHALMAHRGGSLEFVENTLPAFRHAASLEADILEMDCQLTKDGQVVVFHDNYIDRMCGTGEKKTIGDFNYKELPPIQIPAHLKDKREVVDNPDSYKIPLFEQVLMEFPDCAMQVDVKHGPEELVIKTGDLIKKYNRERKTVCFSTFIVAAHISRSGAHFVTGSTICAESTLERVFRYSTITEEPFHPTCYVKSACGNST